MQTLDEGLLALRCAPVLCCDSDGVALFDCHRAQEEMKQQAGISTDLALEHRRIDERFERFQQYLAKGQVNADLYEEAAGILHRHIYLEEEILFPEVEARGLVGPTAVLVQEHGEICRFLDGVQACIQRDAKPRRIQDA